MEFNVPAFLRKALPHDQVDNSTHYVYWLYDDTCVRPGWDGYIGVTRDPEKRLYEHSRSKRHPPGFKMMIMIEGFRETCFLYEFTLRPHARIGWNIAPGGAQGFHFGIPRSEETKKKIGDGNRGNIRPDLTALNKSLNHNRFKDLTCPHCGKFGSGPTMMRYHFKNCKLKGN